MGIVARSLAISPVSPCFDELVQRATAIATGVPRRRDELGLTPELARRIDRSEGRALLLASAGGGDDEGRREAALEFVAEAVTTLVLEKAIGSGEARLLVADLAGALGASDEALSLAVFLRALGAREIAQLPPGIAIDLLLQLLVELAPADAVSLWADDLGGRMACIAASGDAPESRRMRATAKTVFSGGIGDAPHVRAAAVLRWDALYGALVARGRPEAGDRLSVFLNELAAALSPLLERSMLFEQNAARERALVSGTERRLVRLGFDLHDGPLQELVALATDLRLARADVTSILDEPQRQLVAGRFEDFEARLAALDSSLRDIAHSVRSTSALEQPLEHALRNALDAFRRATRIEASLEVDGDISTLTASQKIALFRVAQESLSNIQKHSRATVVKVQVHSVRSFVTIAVSDDGVGFDLEIARKQGRLGLAGIVERVRLLGGDVDIDSSPGEGVLVQATLPRWRPAVEPTTPVYAVTL